MERPQVGVAVFVLNMTGHVVAKKRKNAHGDGTWGLPGGHVEAGEDPVDTCKREVLEEVGLEIEEVVPVTFANAIFEEEDLHYVTLYYVARCTGGELENKEPEKCSEVEWYWITEIPEPRFGSLGRTIEWVYENGWPSEGTRCP